MVARRLATARTCSIKTLTRCLGYSVRHSITRIVSVSSNSAYPDWANVWNRRRLDSFPTDSLGGSRASSDSGLKKLGGPGAAPIGLGGGLKFESPSARSLEHVIVSVCKGRADELSTLMRTSAQGGKYLHSDTADKNERLKLKRSSRFR